MQVERRNAREKKVRYVLERAGQVNRVLYVLRGKAEKLLGSPMSQHPPSISGNNNAAKLGSRYSTVFIIPAFSSVCLNPAGPGGGRI